VVEHLVSVGHQGGKDRVPSRRQVDGEAGGIGELARPRDEVSPPSRLKHIVRVPEILVHGRRSGVLYGRAVSSLSLLDTGEERGEQRFHERGQHADGRHAVRRVLEHRSMHQIDPVVLQVRLKLLVTRVILRAFGKLFDLLTRGCLEFSVAVQRRFNGDKLGVEVGIAEKYQGEAPIREVDSEAQ